MCNKRATDFVSRSLYSLQKLQCFFHFIGCDFVFADIAFGCCFYFSVSQSMFEFGDWGVTGGEERGVGTAEVMVFEVDTKFSNFRNGKTATASLHPQVRLLS